MQSVSRIPIILTPAGAQSFRIEKDGKAIAGADFHFSNAETGERYGTRFLTEGAPISVLGPNALSLLALVKGLGIERAISAADLINKAARKTFPTQRNPTPPRLIANLSILSMLGATSVRILGWQVEGSDQ